MKTSPIALFFKSHIDTFTRKDGTVVQAHEDKRTKREEAQRASNGGKDWRDEENWHTRTQEKMKTHSEDELRFIHKDATDAAVTGERSGFDAAKTGKYRDEAHYASMELKRRQDAAKADKAPGIWEDDKQRERLRDSAVRWANKEQGQYGSKWMRENLAAHFEDRWHIPRKFTQPEIDKWFPPN